jgi:uncharacterized integral membrane protein (TIGR00697 family)
MKAKVSSLYMFFGILFTTCLLVSNVIASKQFMLGPWALTAGVLCFPISYILSDVVAEVYGFIAARRIIWFAFAMNLIMVVIFQIALLLPAPAWFQGSEAFKTVLSSTPRLLAASLVAYLIGSWLNAAVISKMKVSVGELGFGIRAVASTIVGELADSLIFIPVAFAFVLPWDQLPMMILMQVVAKTLYEIIALPLTSRIVKAVKKYEGEDVYDMNVNRGLF